MSYPDYQLARALKIVNWNTAVPSNVGLNNTSWSTRSETAAILEAEIGDVLRADLNAIVQNDAVELFLDAATMSAVPAIINRFGPGTDGAQGWRCPASAWSTPGGSIFYAVQAADISASGQVTVRLAFRTGTATTRNIFAGSDAGLQFVVQNIGPVDPY